MTKRKKKYSKGYFLKSIISLCKQGDQNSLFDVDHIEKRLIPLCVGFLQECGFCISSPPVESFDGIKSYDDLIIYFYDLQKMKSGNRFSSSYNLGKDRSIAARLVDSRMVASGCSKEVALQECGRLVKTLFDHIDEFNFDGNIEFSIFGQDKLLWLTNRLLSIMNSELAKESEVRLERLYKKIIENQQDNYTAGYGDLDELL